MKKFFFAFGVFLGVTLSSSPVFAAKDIGEGYAKTNFKELTQTLILMGGLDMSKPDVADEYARLVYCDMYQKSYENDVEWNKIRKQIIGKEMEKKESFRVFFETSGVFNLEKYDFENQAFPISEETKMKNIGSMVLMTREDFQPYCESKEMPRIFSANIILVLSQPLTLEKINIPVENVETIIARMLEAKNADRQVYGRIRFRVTDAIEPTVSAALGTQSVELMGEIKAIDFFLDKEMTKPISSVVLTKN